MKPNLALPLQQHPHFASALNRMGRDVRFIDVEDAAPVLTVNLFGQRMTSRGPLWQGAPRPAALRKAGLRLVNLDRPYEAAMPGAGFRRIMTHAHVAELDLTTTPQARQSTMKPKWRNAWRYAQNSNLRVIEARYDAIDHAWLLKQDQANQRAKRFRSMPHALVNAYATSQPQSVRVLAGYVQDTPIAAMLFLLHGAVATYHIGWTDAVGRSLNAHHRMIITAADLFAERGCSRLDLGSIDTENAPGLARFKIGTGAGVRPLGGTWVRLAGR
jgi:hypothetical protein